MLISIIAAMSINRVIGVKNQSPWHLPADLQHFKMLTLNKPIIMGRTTFDSIGKALPNRQNIILTSQKNFTAENCEIAHSITTAIDLANDHPEIMIIGGANVYEQFLPIANRMYLTFVDTEINGDTFFPSWDKDSWKEIERELHAPDEKNKYAYSFCTLVKN